jgi:hypothetical protein
MRRLLLTFLVFQFALIQTGLGGIAQAQPPYATADFLGTYGFGVIGTVIFVPPVPPTPNCAGWTPVSLPISISGTLTGDGKGDVTGTETFNANGQVCSGTLAGTYTLNSDGTGTLNNVIFTPNGGSPAGCTSSAGTSAFTFSNGVNRIDLAGTDCFQVTSGTATKQ